MAEEKIFFSSAYKRLVHDAWWEARVLGRKSCHS